MAVKDRSEDQTSQPLLSSDDSVIELRKGARLRFVYEAGNWHTGGRQLLYFRVRRSNEVRRFHWYGILFAFAAIILTVISFV